VVTFHVINTKLGSLSIISNATKQGGTPAEKEKEKETHFE
jgi:hypothetical protein